MSIPDVWQPYVERFRDFLRDTSTENRLEKIEESTDGQLYDALTDALDEINKGFMPMTHWHIEDLSSENSYLSWNTLKYGGILQLLTAVGILSSRNTLTYRDTGGVTVQDYDKYGRYINYFNILINKYQNSVIMAKRAYNMDQCYGSVDSPWRSL